MEREIDIDWLALNAQSSNFSSGTHQIMYTARFYKESGISVLIDYAILAIYLMKLTWNIHLQTLI